MADAPNIHTLIPHVENTAVKTSASDVIFCPSLQFKATHDVRGWQ